MTMAWRQRLYNVTDQNVSLLLTEFGEKRLCCTSSVSLFHLRECKLGQGTKATCGVGLGSSLTVNNDVMTTHCFENKYKLFLHKSLLSLQIYGSTSRVFLLFLLFFFFFNNNVVFFIFAEKKKSWRSTKDTKGGDDVPPSGWSALSLHVFLLCVIRFVWVCLSVLVRW